jgi:hypothetical protein
LSISDAKLDFRREELNHHISPSDRLDHKLPGQGQQASTKGHSVVYKRVQRGLKRFETLAEKRTETEKREMDRNRRMKVSRFSSIADPYFSPICCQWDTDDCKEEEEDVVVVLTQFLVFNDPRKYKSAVCASHLCIWNLGQKRGKLFLGCPETVLTILCRA